MDTPRFPLAGCLFLALNLVAFTAGSAATGDPVPGVDVSLEQKPGGNIVTAKTTADGRFSFTGLAPGWYVLRVQRPAPRTTAESRPNAGTSFKNYNSAKSNTAGIATQPATPVGYWLAVEGVEAAEARTLQHVISEEKIAKGSEIEVVVGAKGTLSGRIVKEAVSLPTEGTRSRWSTTPATRLSVPVGTHWGTGATPPKEGPVTLRGQLPEFPGSVARPTRVFLINASTGKVLAESALDSNGTFALKRTDKPGEGNQDKEEICVEGKDLRNCFPFDFLPADPVCLEKIEEEDPPLCIKLKTN